MIQHAEAVNRSVQVVNLDPAAEHFDYPVMAGERRGAPPAADPPATFKYTNIF